MRRPLALLCLLMLAPPAPAFGQTQIPGQLYLNFDDCLPSPRNKMLDCTSTISTTILCVTAKPAVSVNGVLADLGWIDVLVGSDPTTVPPFWQFQAGGCAGSGRIAFSADFTTSTVCTDVWAGLASTVGQWGGMSGPIPDGNHARVKWTTNVTPEQAFAIPAGAEAYIEKITLHQAPAATCPGCNSEACAVYMGEQLFLSAGGYLEISGAAAESELLFLNGPDLYVCSTPTQNSTWGQVKSLYR